MFICEHVYNKNLQEFYSPLRKITTFGDKALVNAWFNINSFEKTAHLEKIDEQGMLSSVDSGTHFVVVRK
jgi:lysophospholipase-2